MLDGNVTDTIEGSALSYKKEYIDIYSCAWGPKDDGKRFGRPGTLASKALELGVKEVIELFILTEYFHFKCKQNFLLLNIIKYFIFPTHLFGFVIIFSGKKWSWKYFCVGDRKWWVDRRRL